MLSYGSKQHFPSIYTVFHGANPRVYLLVSIAPGEQVAGFSWHPPRGPEWTFAPLGSYSLRPMWEQRQRRSLRRQQVCVWMTAVGQHVGKSGGCWAPMCQSWRSKEGRKGTGHLVPWPRSLVFSSARQLTGPAGGRATAVAAVLLPSVWTYALPSYSVSNRWIATSSPLSTTANELLRKQKYRMSLSVASVDLLLRVHPEGRFSPTATNSKQHFNDRWHVARHLVHFRVWTVCFVSICS